MEERLEDTLALASTALHWMGQHRVANALALFSRLVRVREIRRLDELEAFVTLEEERAP